MRRTLVLNFTITGDLCYLSHRETVSMFTRALVRAGIDLCYSEGFNPRPRISLPLPRNVGIYTEGDLLCAIMESENTLAPELIAENISDELPENCGINSIEIIPGKAGFIPVGAEYAIKVEPKTAEKGLNKKIQELKSMIESNEPLMFLRTTGKGKTKELNLSDYIDSIALEGNELVFGCVITSSGTVRVEELLALAGLDRSMLTGPVTRRQVRWKPK